MSTMPRRLNSAPRRDPRLAASWRRDRVSGALRMTWNLQVAASIAAV